MRAWTILWLALVMVAAWAGAPAASLAARLDQALRRSQSLNAAFTGIEVIELNTGKVIYQNNADHLFVPASNVKLFTSALALRRLGPKYRFQTTVMATKAPDALGRVAGDIVWIGSGDPTLSGRAYPYRNNPYRNNTDELSLVSVGFLADQIVAAGVHEVTGDIVGDDTRYPYEPHPGGWSAGDEQEAYGAPVSALIVNDNRFLVQVTPTEEGELAQAASVGMPPGLLIDNRVQCVAQGKLDVHIERTPAGAVLVTGTIPLKMAGVTEAVPVGDPAHSAAAFLRDALIQRGVNVHGSAIARHRGNGENQPAWDGPVVARRTSPPLSDILQVVDKVSQNLHAEVLLREVGAVRLNRGTREAGLLELSALLQEFGVSKDDFVFSDGSGLSRDALVTPAAIAKLLVAMYHADQPDLWMGLLPIGGVDGTLDHRFSHHREASRIQAKTGSLSHVRALSGYAQTKDGTPLAFSILINNFGADTRLISKFLDDAGLALIQ
ncbi:MAG TPA: D-alanyl-D-alanine carboxypeptidase/D-alanyl-D-alanine-endopeptidase [Bryobacteraceae bacterium]|nr:D-alanyl-D-alanine carboxypeptidase/D-alanyl-D-alanine-endopeptidase [Bryobacteraceae bacterium]